MACDLRVPRWTTLAGLWFDWASCEPFADSRGRRSRATSPQLLEELGTPALTGRSHLGILTGRGPGLLTFPQGGDLGSPCWVDASGNGDEARDVNGWQLVEMCLSRTAAAG